MDAHDTMRERAGPVDNTELVRLAAEGDNLAWAALVERYTPLLWSVARAHRLSTADAGDVIQTAWLRLVERLGTLQDPERVGAWLATTVRRECLRVLRRSGRETLDAEAGLLLPGPDADAPDRHVLNEATHEALRRAIAELPEESQRLLRILFTDPAPSYAEVAAALGMPVGSIGPTRGRVLERLRKIMAREGITAGV
jgi:RNA polymerase sigma factor (sigma-70 family)